MFFVIVNVVGYLSFGLSVNEELFMLVYLIQNEVIVLFGEFNIVFFVLFMFINNLIDFYDLFNVFDY